MTVNEGFPVRGPRPPLAAPGVPTPFTPHVHPYPTRYHGGIWTRPVFGLPYVQDVQSVFMPTNFWGCRDSTAGLGALSYQTHRGVFGDQVRGGGVFGEELRGLGNADGVSRKGEGKMASLGIFDGRRRGRAPATGAVGQSTEYAPTFMPMISDATAEESKPKAPALAAADPRVKELQGYLNRVLSGAGYRTLSVDGKLGPATCGAISWYKKTGRTVATGTTKARIDENLSYAGQLYDSTCAGKTPWSLPTKSGYAPAPAPTTTVAAPAPSAPPAPSLPKRGLSRGAMAGIAAAAVVGVGGLVYLSTRGSK